MHFERVEVRKVKNRLRWRAWVLERVAGKKAWLEWERDTPDAAVAAATAYIRSALTADARERDDGVDWGDAQSQDGEGE